MRDKQFDRITNVEKPIRNCFTNQGKYALVEFTDSQSYPDAKVVGKSYTFANIVKISNDEEELTFFADKSERFEVIECAKLQPVGCIPSTLENKLKKIDRYFQERC